MARRSDEGFAERPHESSAEDLNAVTALLLLFLAQDPLAAEGAAAMQAKKYPEAVRAYRALDRYDAHQPFAAWILRIASNHCVDLLRGRARDGKLFGDVDTEIAALESSAPEALETLVDAERSAEIRDAIATLPDKYRLPIVLAYYNDANYDEIAHALGVTRNHVGVLLLRAKQLLRHSLATLQEES